MLNFDMWHNEESCNCKCECECECEKFGCDRLNLENFGAAGKVSADWKHWLQSSQESKWWEKRLISQQKFLVSPVLVNIFITHWKLACHTPEWLQGMFDIVCCSEEKENEETKLACCWLAVGAGAGAGRLGWQWIRFINAIWLTAFFIWIALRSQSIPTALKCFSQLLVCFKCKQWSKIALLADCKDCTGCNSNKHVLYLLVSKFFSSTFINFSEFESSQSVAITFLLLIHERQLACCLCLCLRHAVINSINSSQTFLSFFADIYWNWCCCLFDFSPSPRFLFLSVRILTNVSTSCSCCLVAFPRFVKIAFFLNSIITGCTLHYILRQIR